VILTERLRIDRLTPSDALQMFEYRSDPAVCRYQSFQPGSLADIEAFIEEIQQVAFGSPGTWFQFAVRDRDTGRLIGDMGAHFLEAERNQVEIGFTLSPRHQGQGFATEAVRGLLDFLLCDCHKHRVFASVDPRNRPSVRLLRRVGMRQEAHFIQAVWFKGEWADDMVFAVLASEWQRV
jgi:RimJ/RimL family protein N-acetyltransferase